MEFSGNIKTGEQDQLKLDDQGGLLCHLYAQLLTMNMDFTGTFTK